MENILRYQVEKRHIFDSIKAQISHNLNLSAILQNTLDRVQNFLNLDRLVIYQLDIIEEYTGQNNLSAKTINKITYEVKSSSQINSVLNLQTENPHHDLLRCLAKYRQGFTLAINDINRAKLADNFRDFMEQMQVRAKLVVPINLKGKLWGLLIAHQCCNVRMWNSQETQFLKQIAEYLAIAIYQFQSHEELQQQKLLLEQRVKSQAQQIEDALVAARIASQSKHEFIGNMSHELKTPLTRVIGLSGTLLHWSLEKGHIPLPIEKQRQYLKTIQDSGKHLLKLIENILEFSELQSGKHLLNIGKISLGELCQEVVDSLQVKARELGLNLQLDFCLSSESDSFYGDRERLQEILTNLLDNGLKFTPIEGEVWLRVWQENKQIIFEVEDTGIGISEQQLPLLFESFKPLENFRQRIHDGAGIGLALTKHLVELHGGRIEVESALGEGSIFRIYLPATEYPGLEDDLYRDSSEPKIKKVVLITQDEAIATFICQLLTAADYKVIWLIDAMTAINQIDFLEPEMVILDRDNLEIEIPDVTDAVRAIEKIESTKIILLYSEMDTSEWEHFLENGICDRVQKSINLPQLIDKIEALI